MKPGFLFFCLLFAADSYARTTEEPKIVPNPKKYSVALNRDFQFRKVKLFELGRSDPLAKVRARNYASTYSQVQSAPDASLSFERSYRFFGAVTDLDRRQKYGNYMDFFWRLKRPADVTVRLEYQQEKLRALVQTRQISYPRARGSLKTEFRIIGDEYLEEGEVIAWRCLLISDDRIVAETRSYMWEQQK